MAEKLLLHLQYECARHKILIPWDPVAHRLHPGSSGAAIQQHLNRLRRELITEGHLVPPLPQRPGHGETIDPEIRGYIRDEQDGEDTIATRPVRFGEHVEDRKFNLPSVFNFEEVDQQGDDGDVFSDHLGQRMEAAYVTTPSRSTRHPGSVGRGSMKSSPRPTSSMGMSQHEALQALITHGDVSPTNSNSAEEESQMHLSPTPQGHPLTINPQALHEDANYFTSPSIRRQRSNTAEGTLMPSRMPGNMNSFGSHPLVALPQGTNIRSGADGYPEPPAGARHHGYYNAHAAAWAKHASGAEQPMYPFTPYGYSLPAGCQFPSPPLPKAQQSSQESSLDLRPQPMGNYPSSSFSTMSSGDTHPSEFQGNDNQPCDIESTDGKLDEFFVSFLSHTQCR